MNARGTPQQEQREGNLRLLMDCLARGPMPQVELAAASGLSEATVSNLVRVLVDRSLVASEAGVRNGRRTKVLSLRGRRALWYMGVELARTHVRGTAWSMTGVHADRDTVLPSPYSYSQAIDAVVELVSAFGSDGLATADLAGVVVAVPGLVRTVGPAPATALLGEGYHQIMGWGSVPLRQDLSVVLGVDVAVENDCNVAALAEMDAGAARPYRHFMYLLAHAYVGGGLILDGRIYRGGGGVAGEFGHAVAEPGGKPCWCGGRGCLETLAGEAALVEAAGGGEAGRPVDVHQVVAAAVAGDARCRAAVASAGAAIGAVVGAVATPLDLECVVVGGPLAAAGRLLTDAIRARLTLYVGQLHPSALPVLTAELGAEASALGAALAAYRAGAPG
ncbi:ROK family transcriptional regulator [Streptodolium elevatio]